VEGLDIYAGDEARYLIASSQGDDGYVVCSLPSGHQLLKFRIEEDDISGVDGTSETDGLAVTSKPLPGYPAGLLIVQDGFNEPDLQNFKGVDWQKIQALLCRLTVASPVYLRLTRDDA
jgi:3-phytase